MGAAEQEGTNGELKFIQQVLRCQGGHQPCPPQDHQPPLAQPPQSGEDLSPAAKGQAMLKSSRRGTGGDRWRLQQPALQGLGKERQIERQPAAAADRHGDGLGRPTLASSLLQQVFPMDQAGAAVAPQGLGSHQGGISPGQGLLQHPAVAGPAQLGRTTLRGSEPPIEADRQHQAKFRGQWAAMASRAGGTISSWGVSAKTSAALLGLSCRRTLCRRAPLAAMGAVSRSAM